MVFHEKSFTSLILLAVMIGASIVQSSETQEGTRTFSSAKDLKSLGLRGKPAQPGSFDLKHFAHSLSQRHHSFASDPPANLASELVESRLPAASKTKYSFPGLSGANFLSPKGFPPIEFRNFSASGLNTSKLRDAGHADLGKAR
ncbi:MAG: hypothetical protein ACJ71U_14755 [Terriglobales bacterium]